MVKTIYTSKTDITEAVREIKENIGDSSFKLMIYFASYSYNQGEVAKEFNKEFKGANIIGASSHAEISTGKMLTESITVMILDESVVEDVTIKSITDVNEIPNAIEEMSKYYGSTSSELDFTKYVGIVFPDGTNGNEEKIIERIGDVTNVLFVGGSAADNLKFEKTYAIGNNDVITNGAVLALIKPKNGFSAFKTQSFKPFGKKVTVTKTNETGRIVLEIDNKPAIVGYADALGVEVSDLPNELFAHPLAIIMGEEMFVRSSPQIIGDSMYFACSVMEGMEYDLLSIEDVVPKTKEMVNKEIEKLNGASALIQFNCGFRTLQIGMEGKNDEYADIFKVIPTVGFSSFGEQLLGHMNQTATMLLLK